MKKKTGYTDEPMGKTWVVKDFLPPPEKCTDRLIKMDEKGGIEK